MPDPKEPKSQFVSDGLERAKQTPAYKAAVRAIEREVRARYERRIVEAGPVRRLVLKLACRREIRRRIDELMPPEAMYVSGAL